jgi:DNA-binding NarL/FixJ family response regulator
MKLCPKIKVLVVDDHPLARDGISAIVDYQYDLEVVGRAANAAEAIALFESLAPDVTLVDLGPPDLGGIELITLLHAKSAAARFIMLTTNAGGGEIAKALSAGAHAYLFKNGSSEELFTAIRAVPSGRRHLSEATGKRSDVPVKSASKNTMAENPSKPVSGNCGSRWSAAQTSSWRVSATSNDGGRLITLVRTTARAR